ncbi:MAG TPA: ABC transporter permease [Bryobacteraceae bacterium]|nr:ABC transporter permease [Bryobacteraceae bacterium]
MPVLLRDLQYAIRVLRRTPAFTITTVLILALAIGANTAMFSIVDAWFLRPLHFKDSKQLVVALRGDLKHPGEVPIFAFYRDYLDWKPATHSFQGMSAMFWHDFTLTGAGEADHFFGMSASADIFETLGVAPELGRSFQPSDMNGPRVAMIGHQLWQGRFSGSRDIVGRVLTLNSQPYTILGVLPAWFSLRMENQATDPQILSLMQPDDPDYGPNSHHPVAVIARLKNGVDMATAQAELFTVQMALDAQSTEVPKGFGVFLTSLQGDNARFIRTSLVTLLGAVVFVLLIACANVAGLLLGRAAHRQREMALRAALGSGRARLMRQLLTESLLLAFAGAALGMIFAYAGVRGFMAANPFNQLPPDPIAIHPRALAFAAALALLNTLLFGVAPALKGSRVDLGTFLKSRGAGLGANAGSGRNVLVVVEIALSLVLLTGTALVSRTLLKLLSAPLGFRAEHVEATDLTLPGEHYAKDHTRLMSFYDQVLRGVNALPGVQAAAFTNIGPLIGGQRTTITVAGRPGPSAEETPRFEWQIVTPRFFEVLTTSLLQGRAFTEQDNESSPPVAIINQTTARNVFPDVNPIGQQIRLGNDSPWRTIVGVTGTLRTIFYNTLVAKEPLAIYVPARQAPQAGFNPVSQSVWLMVKSARPLTLEELRQVVDSADQGVPVKEIRSMDCLVSEATGQPRMRTILLGGFAVLALMLSAIGVYGLIAQNTAQRTSEIGIRMALGAEAGDVLRMVIRQGMSVAAIGIGVGIGAALAFGRVLSSFLYGVSPTDFAAYGIVAAIVLSAAALAAYLPARRASRVDPLVALRYE